MIFIDEFSSGDLSSNNLYPSIIEVNQSNNSFFNEISIAGRVYNDLGDDDTLDTRDFFTFIVPENKELKSIKLDKYDNSSYGENTGGGGWIGVAEGQYIYNLNDPTALIGGHLIGVADGATAGEHILDELEQEFQFHGMVVPALAPGQISGGKFAFWFQEGNFNSPNEAYVDYTLTFKFGSVSGQDRLVGTKQADQFTFDHLESFGRKTADKIIGFNASHGDTIGVSATACPSLLGAEEITFAKAHSAKEVRRLSRQDIDFVYFQDRGRLFFNGNGSEKGWGEPDEGGLLAILKGKPELSADDFTLLA